MSGGAPRSAARGGIDGLNGVTRAVGSLRRVGYAESMLFFLAIVLFLGGMYLFSLAFTVASFQILVFSLGLLLIVLSIAIPLRVANRR